MNEQLSRAVDWQVEMQGQRWAQKNPPGLGGRVLLWREAD